MESKINTFEKGLYKDSTAINQPDSTYSFALNAVNESSGGEVTALITEEGNSDCISGLFPSSYIIGSISLKDSLFVLFIKDTNSIFLFDSRTCEATELIQTDCLNFTTQIQGVSETIKGCERVIYFCDGVNPDRAINIDNLDSYKDEFGNWDCELMRDRKNFIIPKYSQIQINNNGGSLKLGTYQIILQYEDEDGFQSGFFGHSLQIPITYDSGSYEQVTGGDPLYFPITSKSIFFELSDIDLNYKYLKIFLAETVNHITLYYTIDKLNISSDTLGYTITNTEGKPQIDGAQFNVDYSFYETSNSISQIDGRLLKANVKEKEIDYSQFQYQANNIKVNYVTKAIPAANITDNSGSVKTSEYYTDYRSYMRDEVYSLGIVWVFKNGLRTPAFHIPGREKNIPQTIFNFPVGNSYQHTRPVNTTVNNWDSVLINAGTVTGINTANPTRDFKHLLNDDFDFSLSPILSCERWKAYNTAHRTYSGGVSSDYYSKGELAYWESEYEYPNDTVCSGDNAGERLYPTGKIRYHKMPDTTLEPHFTYEGSSGIGGSSGPYILPLGLEFSGIQCPAEYIDDVQGYYIVRQKRDQINKTVLDKGLIYNNTVIWAKNGDTNIQKKQYNKQTDFFGVSRWHENGDPWIGLIPTYSLLDCDCGSFKAFKEDGSSDPTNAEDYEWYDYRSLSFHGAKNKFDKQTESPSYYKQELELTGFGYSQDNINGQEDLVGCGEDISLFTITGSYTGFNIIPTDGAFTNTLITTPAVYIPPNKELPESILSKHFLNNNQQETMCFEVDDDITNPQEGLLTEDYPSSTELKALYGGIKKYTRTIYGQLSTKQYQSIDSNIVASTLSSVIAFGGDCFIDNFYFMKSAFTKSCLADDCNFSAWGPENNKNSKSRRFFISKQLISYFIECEINTELRHIDLNNLSSVYNTFYPLYTGTPNKFMKLDWADSTDFTPWEEGAYMKNLYLYNTDYSKEAEVKSYFSLATDTDLCATCINEHRTRIAFSEKGDESDSVDNYRVFLANNFRDLPSNTGEITNLFINFNELYAHTTYTIYKVFTKPHELKSDQATLYVGVGGFFSVPSQELVSTDYGYGGSSGKFSTKTTEFGTVYIDDLTGKVFLFTDNLNEISSRMGENNTGMRNWFEENIPLSLERQWLQKFGTSYPLVHQPSLDGGIGFLTYYDPRHKRIIITKKDFEAIQDSYIVSNPDLNNINKFINKSWTISFSFLNFAWSSFHSYLPSYAFNNANNFFTSLIEGDKIWKHGEFNYQTYYGTKHDFIIEYVQKENPVISKVYDKISYIGKCELYDTRHKQFRDIADKTFNYLLAYNSYQTTGKLRIDLKDDPFEMIASANGILAYEKENIWNINDFRDYCINRNVPLNSSAWVNIRNTFPIDLVPNPSAYSPNKSVFDLEVMRDLYLVTRLYFNPTEDIRLTLNGVITDQKVSFR